MQSNTYLDVLTAFLLRNILILSLFLLTTAQLMIRWPFVEVTWIKTLGL